MRQAYLKLEQGEERLKQLYLLDQLGKILYNTCALLWSIPLLRCVKGRPTNITSMSCMIFMQDGFLAMKPLKSAEKFCERLYCGGDVKLLIKSMRGICILFSKFQRMTCIKISQQQLCSAVFLYLFSTIA